MNFGIAARLGLLAAIGGLVSACYYPPPVPNYSYVPCGPEVAGAPPPPPPGDAPPPPPGAPPPAAATPAGNYCVAQTGYSYPPAYPYDPYYYPYAYPYPYYPPVAVGVGVGFHGHFH